MPNGFTYASYEAALTTQIPSLPADPNFQTILPDCIDYAELSIERDLDLLVAKGQIILGLTTPNIQYYAVPSTVIVLESLSSQTGPLVPVSRDFINTTYPSYPTYLLDPSGNPILDPDGNVTVTGIVPGAPTGPPKYFTLEGNALTTGGPPEQAWSPGQRVLIGPAPDLAYPLFGYGVQRPDPLSAANPTTYISTELPDLFWAASMIYMAGYTKNFGAQSDNPQMAVSWEQEYQRLLKGANVEQARSKFQAQGWTAQPVAPIATPPRN